MKTPLISLDSVGKHYPAPGGGTVSVLKGVNLEVESGQSLAIVGPSGSGKSTLLQLIGALDTPTEGSIRFLGRDLARLGESERASIRNRDIGFVFQQHHLLPQCNALENVLVPSLAGPKEGPGTEARARDLLGQMGLSSRLDYRPGQLSGGEQLRVAVARALINQPRLLLADEPTGSLDRAGAERLADLLLHVNTSCAVTLIVVTHALPLARRMGQLWSLSDGVLVPGAGEP